MLRFLLLASFLCSISAEYITCRDGKVKCPLGQTCCPAGATYQCCAIQGTQEETQNVLTGLSAKMSARKLNIAFSDLSGNLSHAYFKRRSKICDYIGYRCYGECCDEVTCCQDSVCCWNKENCCREGERCCGTTEPWCCRSSQKCHTSYGYCINTASQFVSVWPLVAVLAIALLKARLL